MADSADAQRAEARRRELEGSLARLHMRYAGGRDGASTAPRADLGAVYKDQSYIRSKYKGARVAGAAASADAAPVSKTSGIPVFGVEGAADRAGWSKGHVAARQAMSKRLGGVATENSHALGHADFGTDHELSAPAATKAQNTEQLAIELAMRTAAHQLNSDAGVTDGSSLLHAKITDVLHPQTGDLVARRYKLIRRAGKDDHVGTVVFDHIMDGERTHISKADALALGRHVHGSVMNGSAVPRSTDRGAADTKGPTDRKGGVAGAPALGAIAGHQAGVLDTLNAARGRSPQERTKNRMKGTPDRTGVGMVGPAFTDAAFPETAAGAGDGGVAQGQSALDSLRARMAAGSGGAVTPQSLLVSGSLPADNETKLRTALEAMHKTHGAHMAAGADAVTRHGTGVNDDLDDDAQTDIARTTGVPDPSLVGEPHWQFIDHTGKAVKALRRMEADQAGSGMAALQKAGIPLEHLMAAHARRNQYIGENSALVPPVADDDVDDVDKRDADEARDVGLGAGEPAGDDAAPASPVAAALSRSPSLPATPQLARSGSLPLVRSAEAGDRRQRDDELGSASGGFPASLGAAGAGLDDDEMLLGGGSSSQLHGGLASFMARSGSFAGGGGSPSGASSGVLMRALSMPAAAAAAGDPTELAEGDRRGGKTQRRDLGDQSAAAAGRISRSRTMDAETESAEDGSDDAEDEEDDDDQMQ